jgi:dephospho-CoA kinase
MKNDDNLKESIKKALGAESYLDSGEINREFLANKVFAGDEASKNNLEKLNSIVHPIVIEHKIALLEELADKGESLIFVESALIFEADLQDGYDYVITVNAKKELRIKRLIEKRNLTEEQILLRMDNQISDEEKSRLADFTVENNGTLQELEKSSDFIFSIVENLPGKDFDQLST